MAADRHLRRCGSDGEHVGRRVETRRCAMHDHVLVAGCRPSRQRRNAWASCSVPGSTTGLGGRHAARKRQSGGAVRARGRAMCQPSGAYRPRAFRNPGQRAPPIRRHLRRADGAARRRRQPGAGRAAWSHARDRRRTSTLCARPRSTWTRTQTLRVSGRATARRVGRGRNRMARRPVVCGAAVPESASPARSDEPPS